MSDDDHCDSMIPPDCQGNATLTSSNYTCNASVTSDNNCKDNV